MALDANSLYKMVAMEDQMTWTNLVAACFGFGTAPFAANRPDEESARSAIRAAKAQGATKEQFAQAIALYPRKYIKSEHILRMRLREDADRLDKLWKVRRAPR
jgi:hypothetical protein